MEPRDNNTFIGKTGLFTITQTFNFPEDFNHSLNRVGRMVENSIRQVMEDGRAYDFKFLDIRFHNGNVPPYDNQIVLRLAVGLINPQDCELGEYLIIKNVMPAPTNRSLLSSGREFEWANYFLWKRIR